MNFRPTAVGRKDFSKLENSFYLLGNLLKVFRALNQQDDNHSPYNQQGVAYGIRHGITQRRRFTLYGILYGSEEAHIVGLPGENVGRLVYGTLAEETNPVAGVNYQKSGSHILVAKYSKTDPLKEFTTAQALALPVIDGVDGIYILHANSTGKLSVEPTSLSFPKSASTKTFTVHSDSDVTVQSSQEWATATVEGDKVSVKVTANSTAERTAKITVTDKENNSAEVTVTQATGE